MEHLLEYLNSFIHIIFIKIKVIEIIYKDHPKSPFSRVFCAYYKSFLGILKISKYYSSYSAADNAPIEFFNHDYNKQVIWFEE